MMMSQITVAAFASFASVVALAGCGGSSDTSDPSDTSDVPNSTVAPDTDRPAGIIEYASLIDNTGTVTVDVPGAWADVRSAPDGDVRQILASTDVDAFVASSGVPGLRLRSGASPDADDVARVVQADAIASVQAGGCELERSLPYDDGVYVGEEGVLGCGESNTTVHVIGGATDTGTIWFGLVLVLEQGDDATRGLVVDSFFVD